ncbi:hypothetical protein GGQ88_001288 [Novosphingobium hassiacum]|uniref:Uncharacterized protein n=1 Tax=Novosphingobium hassiacum TaxID=173676 RepID=A0A7W6EV90_9SPHN|nr:hypothetical protein [Novosphingobium hassiacum]
MGRVEVGIAVDRGNGEGADRGRRQVDHALAMRLEQFVVAHVRACAGRVEHDGDIGELRHRDQPLDSSGGDRHAQSLCALEPVALRIDADERTHLEHVGQAHDLDHQIGADIARSNDRDFRLAHDFNPLNM